MPDYEHAIRHSYIYRESPTPLTIHSYTAQKAEPGLGERKLSCEGFRYGSASSACIHNGSRRMHISRFAIRRRITIMFCYSNLYR